MVVAKTSVEESPVAAQGIAPLRQCKSVPFCVVEPLMSLATAGSGQLPIASSLPRLAPRISLTGSWIKLLSCSRALWIRTVKS